MRLAEATAAGRRAASGLLYLGGMLQVALLFYWILFLPPEEVTVPGIIFVAFALMAAYLGIFAFAAQAAARRAARLGVPLWLGLPVAWVGAEYLRSQTQLGFPWGLVGYGLIEHPVMLQFLSVTGIFGGSLFVGLVNGFVFAAVSGRGWGRRLGFAALAVLLPLAALAHGRWVIGRLGPAPALDVVLVQGNIGHAIKFKPEYRLRNIRRMIELSEAGVGAAAMAAGGEKPDLVVWPETAAPCYVRLDAGCRGLLADFVDRSGVPLLTGVPDIEQRPDGTRAHWNAAFLLAPGRGVVGRYDKVNLVPFGEAFPYQDQFPLLAKIDFGEADFNRGPGFIPIRADGATLGVMICFESIFPGVGRAYAREGAGFFVNITNDEWFGKTGGPYQHAAMAAARAIECRRGVARAANTGVSFVVDRAGRVSRATPLFTEAVVRAPVELGTGSTFYMRVGDLVPELCLAAAAVMAVVGHRRRRVGGRPGAG